MLASPRSKRSGLSLMEVLVSLAIFLFSLVAINELVNFGSNRALDTRYYQHAAFLCQSKMSELASGLTPLGSVSDTQFTDADVTWNWNATCNSDGSLQGLWRVQVTVWRNTEYGQKISVTLSKCLIDPTVRGSTFDPPPQSTVQTDSSSSSSSSSSSGGN